MVQTHNEENKNKLQDNLKIYIIRSRRRQTFLCGVDFNELLYRSVDELLMKYMFTSTFIIRVTTLIRPLQNGVKVS